MARRLCVALLAAYTLLFAFNSFTRTREFDDPDTMNFIDVARHIAAGQGVTQSTLGFNQPRFGVDDAIPTPLTHQPPLYPLAIAGLSRIGLSITDAALLISVVCYGFILLAGYHIVRLLFGEREALGAVVVLALYAPLRDFSDSAFSDPAGLALLFATFWLLARYAADPGKQPQLAALAGLAAGVAVATRYALAPLVLVGAWFVFIRATRGVRNATLFLAAPGLIALLLIQRNLKILHGALFPHYLPSTSGYLKNIRNAVGSLVSQYSDSIPASVQAALVVLVVMFVAWWAYRGKRLIPSITSVWLTGAGPALLCAFGVFYSIFLIVQRTHSFIDPIGARYMLPGAVTLVMLFAVFVVRAGGMSLGSLSIAGSLIGLLLIGYEVHTTMVVPTYTAQRPVDASDRLKWVQAHTTDHDLIIGEDSVDIPFYFGRPAAVSFSPFPYTEMLPYDKTLQLCRRFKPRFARVLLVLRAHPSPQEPEDVNWEARLGPFVDAARRGDLTDYPALSPLATLQDGRVFEVTC